MASGLSLYAFAMTAGASPAVAQAATDPAGLGIGTLVQTGVTGTLAAALLVFARTTHARALARVDMLEERIDKQGQDQAAYAREVTRADAAEQRAARLEAKLDELNRTVLERYAASLATAAAAVADATIALRNRP